MRLRALATGTLVLATALVALGLAAAPMLTKAGRPGWSQRTDADGRLAVRGGLAFLELSGDAEGRSRQHGRLVGPQIADLLAVMRLNPMKIARSAHLAGCLAAIAPDDRREIAALAAASGVPEHDLLNANATIETMCSAVVRVPPGGAPIIARNMDFIPAGPLGQATVVQVVRGAGRHAYAAVSWPGFIGVISGINDRGLTACILLNWHGEQVAPGEPLPLRTRRILADCGDVTSALTALAASPVGSRHYLLLADTHSAVLAWWTPQGLRIDRPRHGWLVATNLARADSRPVADDARGSCLERCIEVQTSEPDAAWFRRVVSASYLRGENAQAMVFSPASRRLELALAIGFVPAALGRWHTMELGPVLDGASVDTTDVVNLPAERPMQHYRDGLP